jgi:type IX secretion system PorP/SprF family membrane protein
MLCKSFLFKVLLLCCIYNSAIFAQDVHYTQFYTDALRLNPAMTGNFNGDYRVGLNFRNQWQSIPVPYQTTSVYADFVPFKSESRKGKPTWTGAGLNVLYDYAGNGKLSMFEIRGDAAIHAAFTPNLYLSAGASAAFRQRSIDFSQLYFGSQWTDSGFDLSNMSQEDLTRQSFGYVDVNAGINISYQVPRVCNFYLGASVLHLNRPNESFLGSDNRLGARLALQSGGSFVLKNVLIEPAFYYSNQKNASEWVLGSNVVWQLAQGSYKRKAVREGNIKLYTGLWYRAADAIAPLVGIEWNNYRLLTSYDINISALQNASRNRGGIEISLVRVGTFKKRLKSPIYCPRF